MGRGLLHARLRPLKYVAAAEAFLQVQRGSRSDAA